MGSYAEEYFAALERLIGRPEDRRTRMPDRVADGMPPVFALFFDNWPADGVLSAFTLGAGLGRHVAAVDAHVELVVSLATRDLRWGVAAAYLTERCRTHREIGPGATLNMDEPLSDESSMTGFMVTHPHQWPTPPRIDVSGRAVVILEAHPVYASELQLIDSGHCSQVEAEVAGATYDVRRPEIVPRVPG